MTLHIADVSEHQGVIDWGTYGRERPAVIVRASVGWAKGVRADHQWDRNLDGARTYCQVRGWYHYLGAGPDPIAQADVFIAAARNLLPGEFVVLDVEEGDGDLTARALAWLTKVDVTLGGQGWIYTYWPFAKAHLRSLEPFGDRRRWIAAYQRVRPLAARDLWQHTDAERHPGIPNPCDCSIFAGDINDLLAVVGAAPRPSPLIPAPPAAPVITEYPEDHMHSVDFVLNELDEHGNGWGVIPDHDAKKLVSVMAQGAYPPENGYWNLPVAGRQQRGSGVVIQVSEADPRFHEELTAWFVD